MSDNENRTPSDASEDDEERAQEVSPSSVSPGHQPVSAEENTSPSDSAENTDGPKHDPQNAPSTSGSLNQNPAVSVFSALNITMNSQAGRRFQQPNGPVNAVAVHADSYQDAVRDVKAADILCLMSEDLHARSQKQAPKSDRIHTDRTALGPRPLQHPNHAEEEDDATPAKESGKKRKRSGRSSSAEEEDDATPAKKSGKKRKRSGRSSSAEEEDDATPVKKSGKKRKRSGRSPSTGRKPPSGGTAS